MQMKNKGCPNCVLRCLSIQGEVGSSVLVTGVGVKHVGAVFDSREESSAL